MATQKDNPAKEGEVADAEEEEFFTDSEEEDGELLVGRRDVASDDEGEAEEGEIQDGHAAAGISHRHSLQGMTKILWMLVSDFQSFDEDDNIPALPCDGLAHGQQPDAWWHMHTGTENFPSSRASWKHQPNLMLGIQCPGRWC
jgi:hypothetical protein